MSFLNDKQKETIKEFIKFVKGDLDLKSTPSVVLQNGRKNN